MARPHFFHPKQKLSKCLQTEQGYLVVSSLGVVTARKEEKLELVLAS